MLQCMEAHNQSSDVDRVNDLIKVSGNSDNYLAEFIFIRHISFDRETCNGRKSYRTR